MTQKSLAGLRSDDEQDEYTVREAVQLLKFSKGFEKQLAVTDVDENLVLVSDLRRFENEDNFATGTHTGGNNVAVLTDSAGDFINKGVQVGDTITNDTDGSSGVITAFTATTITTTLAGGTDDDWDTNDEYSIDKTVSHQSAGAVEVRKVRIVTDLDCYVRFDGDASSTAFTCRLNAGEALNEDDVRVVSRISFINVTTGEQPTLRGWVFGI